MKNDKERKDLNQVLIPRDIGDLTKRRKQLYGHTGMPTQTPEGLTPTFLGSSTEDRKTKDSPKATKNAIGTKQEDKSESESENKKDKKEDQTSGKDDDYMKAYLKKKAAKEKEIKEEIKKNQIIDAQEKAKQLRIDTEHRVKARDLQNQIRLWESYRTQPGYDETQIDAMIVTFKTQLNGIDPKYWY